MIEGKCEGTGVGAENVYVGLRVGENVGALLGDEVGRGVGTPAL